MQPRPEGGTVGVRLWFSEGDVHVEITNPLPDGDSRDRNAGNKMAINNIRSRLTVLYGARANLSTTTRDEQYVTTLKYPINMQSTDA